MIPKTAKKVYVVRAVGDDTTHQNATNDLMVEYAKSKKNVVRLKGGDPIIFGRGGEEAEFLKDHKVKYEIVPGITSGIGSATYAGIPLTIENMHHQLFLLRDMKILEKNKRLVK